MKILIADDDPVSRRLMERTLQKSGYDVVTAEDGAQALEALARAEGPRLALLDWMMPGLDGPEVCRRVRARSDQPYIYITLLTSRLSRDDVVAGLEAGADDYLTKPCNPEELKARLRTGQRVLRLEDTLVEAREEMRFQASHDALTGLWNHGAILAGLRLELTRLALDRVPVSVLLCDVDHFKRVNDLHGHLVGDEILRQIATRLLGAVRSGDSVGRYGGEEFLILLKCCAGVNLRDRAEKVRESVEYSPFPTDSGSLSISVSVGSLSVDEQNAGQSMEAILRKVDAALYLAKTTGRNRIVCADSPLLKDNRSDSLLVAPQEV
jgi:diguanylate cyclase (GGDEF)-like protein